MPIRKGEKRKLTPYILTPHWKASQIERAFDESCRILNLVLYMQGK